MRPQGPSPRPPPRFPLLCCSEKKKNSVQRQNPNFQENTNALTTHTKESLSGSPSTFLLGIPQGVPRQVSRDPTTDASVQFPMKPIQRSPTSDTF
jgi:hypothetical protein